MSEIAGAIGPERRRSCAPHLLALLRRPSIATSAVFAASGGAFALGNLMLARVLPVVEFGRFSFALALFNILILVAPAGVDQFLLRHPVAPGRGLLGRLLLLAAGLALGSGFAAARWGGLAADEAEALALAIAAGGLGVPVSVALRSRGATAAALPFTTGASWLLLAIGAAALVVRFTDGVAPLRLFAWGNVLLSGAGWAMLLREARTGERPEAVIDWREALPLLGVVLVAATMLQLERLVVPWRLGFAELATFSVLASTAIFPFRLLLAGAGYGLVPRLRAAADPGERARIVRSELATIAPLTLLGAVAIVALAPWVIGVVTAGVYRVGPLLTACACLNGIAKLAQSIATNVVQGCGSRRAMAQLNGIACAGLAISVAGGCAGAAFGLAGLLIGIALATLAATAPILRLAARSMRA